MKKKWKVRNTKWAWGFSLILVAALILANHLGGFVDLSVWSLVFAALAVIVLVDCLANLSFAALPLPLAALYYIFQEPLGFPDVRFWLLALVTLLVMCGLYTMLPKRFRKRKHIEVTINNESKRRRGDRDKYTAKYSSNRGGESSPIITVIDGDDIERIVEGADGDTIIEEGEDANNPYIRVKMGSASRYLRAECLQTAELECDLGSLEVYFDNVKLSPAGATAYVSCRLGAIEMYVPGSWRVVNKLNTSLGNAEVNGRLESAPTDSPTLTLVGNVSLGSVEVHRI